MPDFILAGDHSDGATEANHARQSVQHQSAEADELAEQSASGEQHLSLTLVQREYSYNRLKSWWHNMERQIKQNASDDRRKHDWRNSTANGESTPKDGASEPQDNQLEGPTNVVRDLEERVQAPENELQGSPRSDRRSMQATPEALFLAEKLQQLADTTREMAQHLLSPEAVRSRRGSTPGREVPELENSVESRDLELVRRKVQLLDDVVDELSQYRLTPFALGMAERSTEESSESECLRNDSEMTSNDAVVESTNGDGADFQQELDTSNSETFIAGDTPNAVPNARKILNMWSDSLLITDKDLLNAAFTTEQGSEDAETSATSADGDPQYQQFAAELTREPRTHQLPQRETEVGSPRPHLNVSISNFSPQQLRFSMGHLKAPSSNFSPQQLRFSMGHLKLAAGTADRIRRSVSKRDRLDRVTTTALRLLSYPILRHALHEAQTDIIGEDTFVGQKTALQVVQRDVAPSGTEMNVSGSHLDISASDLLLQERGTGICHGNGRPSEVGHTAYQGQQEASKPRGIDGMIALVERLLRLKIMGHA